MLPSLGGAATAPLPPQRFATGSALYAMTRQIGVALGVACLVAILGTARPATDLRTAVSRVGLNAVRSTTYAHAVRILSHSEALRGLEKPLEVLRGE